MVSGYVRGRLVKAGGVAEERSIRSPFVHLAGPREEVGEDGDDGADGHDDLAPAHPAPLVPCPRPFPIWSSQSESRRGALPRPPRNETGTRAAVLAMSYMEVWRPESVEVSPKRRCSVVTQAGISNIPPFSSLTGPGRRGERRVR